MSRRQNAEYQEEQPQWQPSGDDCPPHRPLRPPVVPEQWAGKDQPRDYQRPYDFAAPGRAPGSPPGSAPPGSPPPGFQPPGVPPQRYAPPPGFPPSPGYRPAYGYAPPGYPPAFPPPPGSRSVYGFPPPGSPRPEYLPRHGFQPPRHRPLGKRNAVFLATAGGCAVVLISAALMSAGKPAKPAAASSTPSGTASSAITQAEAACAKRPPASGDIYVRTTTPGASPNAWKLGGSWGWDSAAGKCLSAVQLAIATAPRSGGACTQVGYAAGNPGYQVGTAARRLTRITAQAGPGCASAAPSATGPSATGLPATATPASVPIPGGRATPTTAPSAHRTTPATAPSTPAPTTTAAAPSASATQFGCYPRSDEGTCYEPGDYCGAYDAGVPGVAGDGQAIACADDDGWRWVPA